MKTELDFEQLKYAVPVPTSKLFHIFDLSDGNKSLCSKYMLIFMKKENLDSVEESDRYKKGQDCKSCFKKAGLSVEVN